MTVARWLVLEVSPVSSVVVQKRVTFLWSPTAGRIIRKTSGRESFPNIQDGADHTPSGLDHVGPLKQRGIPYHAVVQQALVAGAGLLAEVVGVGKVHIDGSQA